MKTNIFLLLSFLVCHSYLSAEEYNKLPVVHANAIYADWYNVKEGKYLNWRISPEIKTDTWRVICDSQATYIFYTDIDSFVVKLNGGDTIDFFVKIENKYALSRIIGIQKQNRTLNNDYVINHKNAYFINIPELHELLYIIASITPTGLENPVLFNNHTKYYEEVRKHFYPFKEDSVVKIMEAAVKHLDLLFQTGTKNYGANVISFSLGYNYEFDIFNFINTTHNSTHFLINNNRKVIFNPVYDFQGQRLAKSDSIFINQLNTFIEKTKFMDFFRHHDSLYKEVKLNFDRFVDINTIWNWSEKRFNKIADSYNITISLLYGSRFGENFYYKHTFDNYTELQIFSTTPYIYSNNTLKENIADNTLPIYNLQSRLYLNDLLSTYSVKRIKPFFNIKKWYFENKILKKSEISPVGLFSEYLYTTIKLDFIKNNYDKKMSEGWIERILISNSTSLIRIREFNREFQRLISKSKDGKVESILNDLFMWCSKQ